MLSRLNNHLVIKGIEALKNRSTTNKAFVSVLNHVARRTL